ncbi:unnamed protein product [Aureobasidium pullulans]|nr:unnamed protein product [Aureobasidium pullulans]
MVKPPPKPDTSKRSTPSNKSTSVTPNTTAMVKATNPKVQTGCASPKNHTSTPLTTIFNHGNLLGHPVNFINALPAGYAVFMRVEYTSTSEEEPAFRMAYVFGHPSGGTFDSMRSFSRHVLGIIQGNVGVCNCRLCSGIGGGGAVQG